MSEKVFAPRLARRTFLAASAASAALMLTGCLTLLRAMRSRPPRLKPVRTGRSHPGMPG